MPRYTLLPDEEPSQAPKGSSYVMLSDEEKTPVAVKKSRSGNPNITGQTSEGFPVYKDKSKEPAPAIPQGLIDIGMGGAQIGASILNWLGIVPDEKLLRLNTAVDKQVTDYQTQHGDKPGSTFGRILGQAVATTPIAATRLPGAVSQALPRTSRILTNAAQGAATGALMPTMEGDSRGQNAAIGAGAGIVAPVITEKVLNVIGRAGNLIFKPVGVGPKDVRMDQVTQSFGGPGVPVDITDAAKAELKTAGIDWDGLNNTAKQEFLFAAAKGSSLTAPQLARQSQANSLPIKMPMSRGDLTQNFADQELEDQLIKRSAGGEPMRNLRSDQNRVAAQNFDLAKTTMAGATDPVQTGKSVVGALGKIKGDMSETVSSAYQAARTDPSINNKISFQPVKKLLDARKNEFLSSSDGTSLWNAAQAEIKRITGGGAMTVDGAETFRKYLNDISTPQNARLVRLLKDATDQSVLNSGTSDIFKTARFQHALKQATFTDQGIVGDLVSMTSRTDRKVPYEEVWKKAVIDSDINGLKQIKNTLNVGSPKRPSAGMDAWDDVKTTTLEWLEQRSIAPNKGENGMPIYSGKALGRALEALGIDKVRIIFGKDADMLYNLRDALKNTTAQQGATNPSGTAGKLGNMVQRMLGVGPGAALGGAVGGPAGAAVGAQVGSKAVDMARTGMARRQAGIAASGALGLRKDTVPLGLRLGVPLAPAAASGAITLKDLLNGDRQ